MNPCTFSLLQVIRNLNCFLKISRVLFWDLGNILFKPCLNSLKIDPKICLLLRLSCKTYVWVGESLVCSDAGFIKQSALNAISCFCVCLVWLQCILRYYLLGSSVGDVAAPRCATWSKVPFGATRGESRVCRASTSASRHPASTAPHHPRPAHARSSHQKHSSRRLRASYRFSHSYSFVEFACSVVYQKNRLSNT